jgi:hypothetical protein
MVGCHTTTRAYLLSESPPFLARVRQPFPVHNFLPACARASHTPTIPHRHTPERRFIEIQSDYEKTRKTLLNLSRQPSDADGSDCVPAAAALSFRVAANALKYAMTQRSGRGSPGLRRPDGGGAAVEQPAQPVVDDPAAAEDDPTDEELFSAMQGQWVEVECLLRVQLRGAEALDDARERVTNSLAFDSLLAQRASDSGQLTGTIFQALLARADGSADATASSVSLELGDADWDNDAASADALRKLVRIKVQDDNDLKAANGALQSCADFFSNLRVYASRHGLGEIAVLEKL